MATSARVALLIDTATSWGSGLIEGIVEYSRQHENWLFYLEPRGKYDKLLIPAGYEVDGVLARITHEDLADQLLALGVPAVNLSWFTFGDGQIARCTSDEVATGRLAARYFVDLGLRHFAYCGSAIRPSYFDRFGEAFRAALQEWGYSCYCFAPDPVRFASLTWIGQLEELAAWLRSLHKPVGLLAFDDVQGRQVTEACQYAEIDVPHEVAVLGGEEDRLSSSISRPLLSSVDQSPRIVGYEAAALLAKMMRKEETPQRTVLIPPTRIITRQSTDTVALADNLLSAAMRYIKDHGHERIRIADVLREVPISRRALEQGFRKFLDRSPAEEIRRVRVERALQLLCDTQWPIPKVAAESGFERPELLARAFRRELNITPSQFRKQYSTLQKQRSAADERVRGVGRSPENPSQA